MTEDEFKRARIRARIAAARLLARYSVEDPSHIRLTEIAAAEGVTVEMGQLIGADARLTRSGSSGRIRVSDSVTNAGRRRFSIAHELGHFFLNHGSNNWIRCLEPDFADFGERSVIEVEANLFAVEFLLPEALVRRKCDVSRVDFEPVFRIADEFQTSLTAAALRFVELAPESCALVYSVENTIRWARRSPSFSAWLRDWTLPLDPGCIASDFFRGRDLAEQAEEVPSAAWLEEESAEKVEVLMENSIAMPSAGAVLSLLWIPLCEDDE